MLNLFESFPEAFLYFIHFKITLYIQAIIFITIKILFYISIIIMKKKYTQQI